MTAGRRVLLCADIPEDIYELYWRRLEESDGREVWTRWLEMLDADPEHQFRWVRTRYGYGLEANLDTYRDETALIWAISELLEGALACATDIGHGVHEDMRATYRSRDRLAAAFRRCEAAIEALCSSTYKEVTK